ncbi:MAG: pseudouridine synthase [Betaproteobacteria bacterium]|nr:pseudouridine synthase [Betaproteobacteria bacterium]
MTRIVLFNKPCAVLCQFSPDGRHATLADFVPIPGVYPAGRLDADSEGLVILTDDGRLQHRITHPVHKFAKTYWVQVEGIPTPGALDRLRLGVDLGDFVCAPARVRPIEEPARLWARTPPIRNRKAIPTTWLEVVIAEGKNRQVRRMTAKVGLPTLRLIRHAVGPWTLDGLGPGDWREGPPPPAIVSAARKKRPR